MFVAKPELVVETREYLPSAAEVRLVSANCLLVCPDILTPSKYHCHCKANGTREDNTMPPFKAATGLFGWIHVDSTMEIIRSTAAAVRTLVKPCGQTMLTSSATAASPRPKPALKSAPALSPT